MNKAIVNLFLKTVVYLCFSFQRTLTRRFLNKKRARKRLFSPVIIFDSVFGNLQNGLPAGTSLLLTAASL